VGLDFSGESGVILHAEERLTNAVYIRILENMKKAAPSVDHIFPIIILFFNMTIGQSTQHIG
jgi:hypothetical protein